MRRQSSRILHEADTDLVIVWRGRAYRRTRWCALYASDLPIIQPLPQPGAQIEKDRIGRRVQADFGQFSMPGAACARVPEARHLGG